MTELAILALAGFFAGLLNTIAGGGTFLTFPALVFIGVPPVAANATSTVAVFPGYLAGVAGFRMEIGSIPRRQLIRTIVLIAAGGLAGSFLMLVSSDTVFSLIVPFLLAIATLVFAFGRHLTSWTIKISRGNHWKAPAAVIVGIYGGYFNGGLGIVLLALFSLWGMTDLDVMNALKSALSFILSFVSVVAFSLAELVTWPEAALMMAAAVAGGYIGVPVARLLPESWVRALIILVGTTMSIIFFRDIFR